MIRKNDSNELEIVSEVSTAYSYEQIANIIEETKKAKDEATERIKTLTESIAYYKNLLAQATALGIKPREVVSE